MTADRSPADNIGIAASGSDEKTMSFWNSVGQYCKQ